MNLQNRIPLAQWHYRRGMENICQFHHLSGSPAVCGRASGDSARRIDFGRNTDVGLSDRRLCCAMLAVLMEGSTESASIGSPEMRVRETRLFNVALLVLTCCSVTAVAAEPSPEELLSGAISLWQSRDLPAARDQLSSIIDSGSDDPRTYYYRGILDEQLRGNGDADFAMAAKLEAETSTARVVNRALETTCLLYTSDAADE